MEEVRYRDGRTLRCGYTTGSCAAAAAQAAAAMLLGGEDPVFSEIITPSGKKLRLAVEEKENGGNFARCAVRKDSGDDPDITNGILVEACIRYRQGREIIVDGGEGVGRVTLPGLACEVGEAAINPVPHRMICEAVDRVRDRYGITCGLQVVISVPGGEELARKTYNPRLGITGGLSILGTSGIVEPMSERALVDSIEAELKVHFAAGERRIVFTPGNYGERFIQGQTALELSKAIKCSNFIGDAIDLAVGLGFREILFIGHVGKLVKLAAGIMNTHSRYADGRMEILTAHAALCGVPREGLYEMIGAVTVDQAVEVLDRYQKREAVFEGIVEKIEEHLTARVAGKAEIAALLFSNRYGILGKTQGADRLLAKFTRKEEGF